MRTGAPASGLARVVEAAAVLPLENAGAVVAFTRRYHPAVDQGQTEEAEEAEATLSPGTRVASLLLLIALVHLPLLGHGLIYDDGWTLRSNGFLRPGHFELGLLFSPEAAARHVPDAFRPTLVVFDMLSLRVLGLEPWAHHGLSIALHVGVCAMLARLLRLLGAGDPVRLAAVACFGLLAIHAEAVAVVSFREDLLAALLGLAALGCALRIGQAQGRGAALGWAFACALLEALACGAKLSAAPVPAILLLLVWLCPWPGARRLACSRARLTLAFAALAVGVALALAQTQIVYEGSPYAGPGQNPRVLASRLGLGPVLAASARIHVGYLQQIVLPFNLSPEYVDEGASWTEPSVIVSLLALLGLAVLALITRRRAWALSLAIGGWLLACVPTSNLIGLPNMRADRFMYLPSVPLCIGGAVLLLALGRWLGERRDPNQAPLDRRAWSWAPLFVFVFVQGSFGMAASRVYVSNTTLWHTAVRKAPRSARAHALMGLERLASATRGDELAERVAERARRSCLRAQELDPRYELPRLCLGSLAIVRERWGEAYEHHAQAVELSIDRNDRPIAALAQLALDLPGEWLAAHPELGGDRRALARAWLERGLGAYPYSPELHAAAGRVFHRLGQPERALQHYRRARSLRPDRWQTVAMGVELALDLGDAAAAYHTWWANAEFLSRADPVTRARLRRRLAEARTQSDFSLLHSLLSPGVFPNEP